MQHAIISHLIFASRFNTDDTEEKTQKQTTNSQFSLFEKSEGRNKVPLSLNDPLASFSVIFFPEC